MFKVSLADFCRFDPATTSADSAYSSSPSCLTTAEYPSLGAILEAIAISHCASQLPEGSKERHEMIRSRQQMQSPNNLHSLDQGNAALTKKSEREPQGNDALLSATSSSSVSPAASTLLFPLIVDPYRVLQVRRDATPQEIRHAYRRLSLWHHPGRSIHIEMTDSSNNNNSNSNRNGNSDNSAECAERYRRCQVFEILAACYETLLDKESRRRCDGLLRDVELQRKQKEGLCSAVLPAGDIRVGQAKNKVVAAPISPRAAATVATPGAPYSASASTSVFQRIPTLTPASSSGSSLEGVDHLPDQEVLSLLTQQRSNHTPQHQQQQPRRETAAAANPLQMFSACGIVGVGSDSSEPKVPSLMKNSTSSTTDTNPDGVAIQYSETETNRLYGGPLQLLYRSRRWKPFMDPLELFAQVFGSRAPLGIQPEKDWSEWKAQAKAAASASVAATSKSITTTSAITAAPAVSRSAAWTGSSETLPDGTVVFTTRRTLNDRVMTRTETVRTDKMGRKHSYVSVTSETVLPPDCDPDAKAKQEASANSVNCDPISDCHVLESCMFFYKDHCGGTDTASTTAASTTFDKTTNHSHVLETNLFAAFDDEITSAETDESEAGGCHALGACLVWNPATSAYYEDDNLVDDECKQDDPEYTGTNSSSSNNKADATSPRNVKDSRGAAESLLDPLSWGLCGQWFPG
jgi:hypothetical protein